VNVLIFGATGMVGQGVLRECLADPDVKLVLTVGRTAGSTQNPKLRELVHQDLSDYQSIGAQLTGFDACFFCLGVSSSGMTEQAYTRVTYDFTLAAGHTLCRLNPQMTFMYVSGAGTDRSEKGRGMWARVKGKTENALLRLPFKAAYMFRPGIIQPLGDIRSKTPSYRILYAFMKPVLSLLLLVFPNQVLTTTQVGQAMLAVAKHGYPKQILEARDIRAATSP
jgi:uncharacterized protein YbjT (DUF2867 family)